MSKDVTVIVRWFEEDACYAAFAAVGAQINAYGDTRAEAIQSLHEAYDLAAASMGEDSIPMTPMSAEQLAQYVRYIDNLVV